MAKNKTNPDTWHIIPCSSCKKKRAERLQPCCHRYLCHQCHMEQCETARYLEECQDLKRLIYQLHIALNKVIDGKPLPADEKETLDENVSVYLGTQYADMAEESA